MAAATKKRCAFLTMDQTEAFVTYDSLVIPDLEEAGWSVEMIPWKCFPDVDWAKRFDAVVVRSPWDYQQDPKRFTQCLRSIVAAGVPLQNPLPTLLWNMSKAYLVDLAKGGVPVVPSVICRADGVVHLSLDAAPPTSTLPFDEDGELRGEDTADIDVANAISLAFDQFKVETEGQLIIKPLVSASSDWAYHFSRRQLQESAHPIANADGSSFSLLSPEEPLISYLCRLYRRRPFLLQRFEGRIFTDGEYSVFLFGGDVSHAILKRPAGKTKQVAYSDGKEGGAPAKEFEEFRVQEEFGGIHETVPLEQLPAEVVAVAIEAARSLPDQDVLYLRIDVLCCTSATKGVEYRLLECEALEPSLYFNHDFSSIKNFVKAFLTKFSQ